MTDKISGRAHLTFRLQNLIHVCLSICHSPSFLKIWCKHNAQFPSYRANKLSTDAQVHAQKNTQIQVTHKHNAYSLQVDTCITISLQVINSKRTIGHKDLLSYHGSIKSSNIFHGRCHGLELRHFRKFMDHSFQRKWSSHLL